MDRPDYNTRHWDGQRFVEGPAISDLEEQIGKATAKILTLNMRKVKKMLKGNGFIVIVPSQPRLDVEEHQNKEDAENEAAQAAHVHGMAIIYVPLAVVRPKRETVSSEPSKLLQQINSQRQVGSGTTDGSAEKK